MSDDRKKSVWPWIVALVIGLPVLYVASFGPACWLTSRGWISDTTMLLYIPLANLPEPIAGWIELYGNWFADAMP